MAFRSIDPKDLDLFCFEAFGDDWALLTAGTPGDWNTMTIGWGDLGTLWSRPVATVYVRPDRHTHEFMERSDRFTIAFFDEEQKDKLSFCGSHSGRDTDKTSCGLTPTDFEGAVGFEEAELVICCRIIYAQDFEEGCFRDPSVRDRVYGGTAPLHTAYVGLVEAVWADDSLIVELSEEELEA